MIHASVIIPTRDRADALERCLVALTRQTLSPEAFEVIVVNNGSRNATRDVVARYGDRLNLRCLFAPEPGLHVGRHAGYRAANSDVLMYTDDDAEAEPTWVEAVVRAFSDPQVALVGGNNLPRFETKAPDWLTLWWSRPAYKGRALGYLSILDFGVGRFEIDPHYIWGCNFSVRRCLLEAAGGFHPDGVPSELLRLRGDGETHVARFVARARRVALFDSEATVHHYVGASRMTADYFRDRGFAQGVSDSYTAIRRAGRIKIPARQRLATRLRPLVIALREHWQASRARRTLVARALLEVQLGALKGWRDGYMFHRSAVREDPALLQWVLRQSYL